MNNQLHIISFNVPYPPDYGGVIDVYYKIMALKEAGIKIHLHCYEYGRKPAEELNALCKSVNYYHREHNLRDFSSLKPFIVKSRRDSTLLKNLEDNKAPILFEGLHTCYFLDAPSLKNRNKLVRMHNVEADYYRALGSSEQSMLRKFYFYTESVKLRIFEKILNKANHILPISFNDFKHLDAKFDNVSYLPAFHPNEKCLSKAGKGNFILYHGNLSINENIQAAVWLAGKVFSKLNHHCVIAGSNPSPTLVKAIAPFKNIDLVANPSESRMNELLAEAHVNILPTFQQTGVKLKLLNALFKGRFVVVNPKMAESSGLMELCIVNEKSDEMIASVNELMEKDFSTEELERRKNILEENYNNANNALKLIQLLNEPTQ